MPVAGRLARALARNSHELAARALRRLDASARVDDPEQPQDPADGDQDRRDPEADVERRTEASLDASATEALTSSGTPWTDTAASGCFLASSTARATSGRAAALPTSSSRRLPKDAATTAPTAAIATSPATRAIALLTPEAIPALLSSASASTVEVSGATVIDSPSPNTSRPGSRSVRYSTSASTRMSSSAMPHAAISGPTPMKKRGP